MIPKEHIEKAVQMILQELETYVLLGTALDCMSERSKTELHEKLKKIIREEVEREPTRH